MPRIIYFISVFILVTFQSFGQGIVVNEIMYNPLQGEAEWIEIYNSGNESIDIQGWKIGDASKPEGSVITEESYIMFPNDYVVIRNNSDLFINPGIIIKEVIMETGFPRLNNDGDEIILRNIEDRIIDSVSYSEKWGGEKGVSLEKINPLKGSNESSNWGTCTGENGGTPGEENSIYTTVIPNSVSIEVLPNPFSPDGDGIDDNVVISYLLPFEYGTVRLEIYNSAGILVRRLLNNDYTGSSRAVNWDGKDNNGKVLPIGIYIIYLEAMKSYGGVKITKKSTVVLAGQL